MSYSANDIAKKLVLRTSEDRTLMGGEGLTNLKLQKLLYYMQGYHLAAFKEPLFNDDVESWMYGPVVPNVYDHYSSFGYHELPVEETKIMLNAGEEKLFNMVFLHYRNYSAIGLLNMTHGEKPWIEAVPHTRGTVIDIDSMKLFFEGKLASLRRESLSETIEKISSVDGESIVGCHEIINAMPDDALDYIMIEPSEWGGVNIIVTNDDFRISVRLLRSGVTWYRKDAAGVIFHEEQPWNSNISNAIVSETVELINGKEDYYAGVR